MMRGDMGVSHCKTRMRGTLSGVGYPCHFYSPLQPDLSHGAHYSAVWEVAEYNNSGWVKPRGQD